jgi:hypothetical protein
MLTGRQAGALLALLLLLPCALRAQTTLEVYGGDAYNIPFPVTVTQRGFSDLKFTPHFNTDPWEDTWYYQVRLGLWKGARGWLVEFLHHKLYLDDEHAHPAEIARFDITNGFSMVTLSRGWRRKNTVLAAGGGIVIAYPITTVRGKRNGNEGLAGYKLSGASIIGTVNQRLPLGKRFYLAAETRLSLSYARVPINGGHASIPNSAVHLHLGAGVVFP